MGTLSPSMIGELSGKVGGIMVIMDPVFHKTDCRVIKRFLLDKSNLSIDIFLHPDLAT